MSDPRKPRTSGAQSGEDVIDIVCTAELVFYAKGLAKEVIFWLAKS